MSDHKVTTLQDGYDISYYPQTYAHIVKRQFTDESVESSLQRLEYFNHTIYDQNKGVMHDLISIDPTTHELRTSGLKVTIDLQNVRRFENGMFMATSDGLISGVSLILTGLTNGTGNILTVNSNGQVLVRTPDEILLDIKGAPLDSPALTGVPTAPTADRLVNSTQLANAEFVHTVVDHANKHWGFIKVAVDGWSTELDAQNYYTQTIIMPEMLEEYKPIFNLIVSNYALEPHEKEGFFNLGGITTFDGYIVIRTQVKPTVDLFLDVKGV